MLHEYPTKDDFQKLAKRFPTKHLKIPKFTLQAQADNHDFAIRRFISDQVLMEWEINLTNKIYDIFKSYVMLTFYYELGIPDDEWEISPGKNGASTEYFPHFNRRQHFIKSEFDFYSDVFYFKLFSALDVTGHILNEMYLLNLKVEKVDFKRTIEKLLKNSEGFRVAKNLDHLRKSAVFEEATEIRNSIAPRHPANALGSGVTKFAKNHIGFGGHSYTTSRSIVENINQSLELLVQIIDCLKNDVASFRESDTISFSL